MRSIFKALFLFFFLVFTCKRIPIFFFQIQWCKQIFHDSHAIVINLFTKIFEEFNKHFAKYLDEFRSNAKSDGYFLENLAQYKHVGGIYICVLIDFRCNIYIS